MKLFLLVFYYLNSFSIIFLENLKVLLSLIESYQFLAHLVIYCFQRVDLGIELLFFPSQDFVLFFLKALHQFSLFSIILVAKRL